MLNLSEDLKNRVAKTLAGDLSPRYPMDDEAASHGAIALWGTIGLIVGLRPDGTLLQFSEEFDVPLSPVPEDHEISSLVLGSRRHTWLESVLPIRSNGTPDCDFCKGIGFLKPTKKSGVYGPHPKAREDWKSVLCPTCQGLGWVRI